MADATDQGDVVVTNASDDATPESQATEQGTDVGAAEARIKSLEAELAKANDILAKARKGEKYAKQSKQELEQRVAELESQGDWKAKYEQLVQRENTRAIDAALSKALQDAAKPESLNAALKLIERAGIEVKDGQADAKAVEAAVLKAREDFPSLFVEVKTPAPVRAAEAAVTSGYEKEVRAAKSIEEIEAIARKYSVGR